MIAKFINITSARNYYYSSVYAVIKYGILVYGGSLHYSSLSGTLLKLQKRILSNLFSRFFPGVGCIFKRAGILKILDIHRLYAAICMFRILKLNECPTIAENLCVRYPDPQGVSTLSCFKTFPIHEHKTDSWKVNYCIVTKRLYTIEFNKISTIIQK